MESMNKKWLAVAVSSLLLAACGGSDDNDNHDHDEHEHDHEFSVLVSQTGTDTLSLLEEGELEALDDAAAGNGAQLVLSDNGAYAAVLANTTVNFVHGLHEEEHHEEEEEHTEEEMHDEEEHAHEHEEAHVLEFSLTGSQVISTNGHFAVLNSDSTTFVGYDELATLTSAPNALNVGNETYPALMLDEGHGLHMVFTGGNAVIYENGEAVDGASFACATPTSHGQTDELVVVSCGNTGVIAVVIEEDNTGEHAFEDKGTLTLSGTAADYVWRAQGHVIAGFEPNTGNYAIVELDETQSPAEVEVNEDSHTGGNVCALGLDSEASDVLFVTSDGKFVALNHEGEELETITLDFSTNSSCNDFVLATANKTALLIDNNAMKGYEIDVDDPESNPDAYHVHEDFDLTVSNVSSMVIFHEMEHEAHEGENGH
ncbi:hypothetical protein [Bermanella marisrubri]|uniref:Lipoprotein n=1 Tax=Bermanella marisrubri TaxID=207949 RepID=Q1MYL0_9GAMM|nr:hypothetical protein [Bermanella marisrubri]EAT11021.1 hypothetical protein RED65_14277 [Oceanobacter sp. RED65] [Bermanella marisrubri]